MNLDSTSDQVKALLDSAERATQAIGGRIDRARWASARPKKFASPTFAGRKSDQREHYEIGRAFT